MPNSPDQNAETKPKAGVSATTNVLTHLLVPLVGSDGPNFVNVAQIRRNLSEHPNDKNRLGEADTLHPENT